ncbi:Response regulator receiver protein [Gammaproteobacteria bacterium]
MKKILIVDDQPIIRKMVRMVLKNYFALDEAENGDSALEQILVERPDGMVLDVMMPGNLNGFQLCERIKRDPALASIHVVLVTACAQVADQELGRAIGADAYFIKPFSPLALVRHLTEALNGGPQI